MSKYTEKLKEKGAERMRLTKQLVVLVGNAAKDIAQSLPEGTLPTYEKKEYFYEIGEAIVKGDHPRWARLEVVKISSNLGDTKFLASVGPRGRLVVFVPDKEPGTSFFLDNDPRARVEVASAKEYLEFANDLLEIGAGFEKKADELIAELRKGFDKLREIASVEVGG
jgi:hypothetical protein